MNKIDIASTRLTDRKAIGEFELKVPVKYVLNVIPN